MNMTSIALELNLKNKAYKIRILIHFEFLKNSRNWVIYCNYKLSIYYIGLKMLILENGWLPSTIMLLIVIYTCNKKFKFF
jgi:hypothetical protein